MGKAQKSANGKLNVALIGSGGIAKTCFRECEEENLIAIAEVDTVQGAEGLTKFPDAKHYTDFRKMLDKHWKELDAVIVCTPDHTHFAATYAAMERGIAVHTQKPLTHNIWQARTLQAAAQKFKVQTVMGNQGHNMEGMRLIKDWYDAGLIGNVREVHAWTGRSTPNTYNAAHPLPAEPVPATLDWDLWLGPNAVKDYNSKICPQGWRWWWEYGSGGLGDIGCHTLDIPKYVMGLGYPEAVYMDNSINFREEFDGKKPKENGAGTYVYEFKGIGKKPPVTVYWYEGGNMPHFSDALKKNNKIESGGCLLIGDKNTIYSPGMRPDSPRLENDWDTIRRGHLPPKNTPRAVGNPVKELFTAIRGDIPKCGSNFIDYAVPLTEMVLLGTIANRSGKKVEYNPATMDFKDRSLNQYIKEPVRKGWEYGEA
jgi:predicted dehydrogenase